MARVTRRFTGNKSRLTKRNRTTRPLALESLENRQLLAADTFAVIDSMEAFGAAVLNNPVEDKPGPGEMVFLAAGPHPDELEIMQSNNVAAADSTNADQLQPGGSSGLNLTGDGYTVGVWDGGLVRSTHQEFGGRVTTLENDLLSGHATHVAGTIAAAGVNADALGMASDVNIRSWNFSNDVVELWNDAPNLDVSNHSYSFISGWNVSNANFTPGGSFASTSGNIDVWWQDYSVSSVEDSNFGEYTTASAGLDTVIHNHPHLLSVWAASNDRNDQFLNSSQDNTYVTFFSADPGGIGWSGEGWYLVGDGGATPAPAADGNGGTGYDSLPAQQVAKNTLVVGAVHDVTADPYSSSDISVTSFSSFGGTDDGRIKPDVVGNGFGVFSTNASSDAGYDSRSGTSMAAPNVAGSSVLLIEHYNNKFGMSPSAATSKALLIHTATDAGNVGPDYAYGWGLVDVAAAAELVTDASTPGTGSSVRELTYQGTAIDQPIYADGTTPLKATIAWTDPAGTPVGGLDNTSPMLVNDLDLVVTGPDGTHYPWTLDISSPTSAARRTTSNHVDNVEQVLIDAPVPGVYTVQVSATGSVSNQDFSIVIEGGSLTGSMVSVVEDVDDGNYAIGHLSLREALELSNQISGTQTITFDPNVFSSPQTIHLNSQLPQITDSVNIMGPGPANATIDGGDAHRIFFVFDPSRAINVSMSGLTLANGRADTGDAAAAGDYGGGIYSAEAMTLTDMVFVDNVAMNGGGGFYGGGALTRFENVHFVGNEAIHETGGGFHDGNFELINSTVENNGAVDGGGIFGAGLIQSSTIQGNIAEDGGGLFLSAGTATIVDSTLSGNTADSLGGGIRSLSGSTLNLTNSTLSGNAANYGGGIHNAGTANIAGSTVSGSSAYYGGGIYNNGTSHLTLTDSTVSGNSASDSGAGLNNAGTANISRSTVSGNDGYIGGGIYNDFTGELTLSDSTVSGNRGDFNGGAIANYGIARFEHSTLSGNYSYHGVGGVDNFGAARFEHSTLTGNSSYYGSGGLFSSGSTHVTHSIIAGNVSDNGVDNVLGSLASDSFNLIDVDPLLGPLADHGGPTLTHAPLPGSPAIGAGDPAFQPPLVNIAATGIATQLGTVLPAENAIDGDLTTYSSTIPVPGPSWNLDLQEVQRVEEVVVHFRSPAPGIAIYVVRLTDDSGNEILTTTSTADMITLPSGGVDARYVRVELFDPTFQLHQLEILEVEVLAEAERDFDQRGEPRILNDVIDIGAVESVGFFNPGFELGGGSLQGWTPFPGADVNVSTAQQFEGAHAAQLSGNGNGFAVLYQGVPVTPGDRLTANVQALVDATVPAGEFGEMRVEYYSAFGAAFGSADHLSAFDQAVTTVDTLTEPNTWQEVELPTTAPAGAVEARFVLTYSGTSGSVFYDASGVVLSSAPELACDFTGDGACSAADVDLLQENLVNGPAAPGTFDITGDGLVTIADRDEWLVLAGAENLASGSAYLLGDGNLDGVVDGSDFNIWNSAKFTTTSNWSQGDFNSDGVVDGSDFNLWNANKFQSSGLAILDSPDPARYANRAIDVRDRIFASLDSDDSEGDSVAFRAYLNVDSSGRLAHTLASE